MSPHSANPHEQTPPPVMVPRMSAARGRQQDAPEGTGNEDGQSTSEPRVRVVSTSGWSPTAWRLGR